MTIDEYFNINPFSFSKEEKNKFLIQKLNELINYHSKNSKEYNSILKAYNLENKKFNTLEDMLFLPVRIFKEYELKSTNDIIKILTSSGTTSQKVSKIFLDKQTATLQTKALIKIIQSFIGKQRLPMLIIDTKAVFKNKNSYSARGAGILGFSNFGRDHTYVFDEKMNIDFETIEKFLKKYKNQKILMFGFTFIVWEFYEKYKKSNKKLDLSNAVLFHSGGWKKLIEKAVDNKTFKQTLKETFNISQIHNFYGMAEQVGSIFVECEYGHLHTPLFADIIIRDFITLKPNPINKEGIIEVLSILPKSYPGHILLTEDIGVLLGEDDCKCGRKGKYFIVKGRLKKAEIRGCSDTYALKKENNV